MYVFSLKFISTFNSKRDSFHISHFGDKSKIRQFNYVVNLLITALFHFRIIINRVKLIRILNEKLISAQNPGNREKRINRFIQCVLYIKQVCNGAGWGTQYSYDIFNLTLWPIKSLNSSKSLDVIVPKTKNLCVPILLLNLMCTHIKYPKD